MLLKRLSILTASVLASSCAIHYYDKESEAEHIFGFGHLVMKASSPKNSHQAIVQGSDIWGLGLGTKDNGAFFSLGWDSVRKIKIIDKNTIVDLRWPDSDFFNTRIGSSFPGKTPNKNYTQEGMQ